MSRSYYIASRYWIAREGTELETPAPWEFLADNTHLGSHWDSATEKRHDWFVPDALTHGDYVGCGTIGRSNIRVLRAEYADLEGIAWVEVYGSHGWNGIAVRNTYNERDSEHSEEEASFVEFLDGLEDYCIADESDLSEVEQEEEQEQWSDWGRDEFRRELAKAHPEREEAIDAASDETLDRLYWGACEASGTYPEHTSHEVLFSFERVLPHVDVSELVGAA